MTATLEATPRRHVETAEYTQTIFRMVQGLGRRVAAGDVDELPALLEVAEEAEKAFREAGQALNAKGYSWAEIGLRLGTTRQSAYRRCTAKDPK
jgi:hypothetical protein